MKISFNSIEFFTSRSTLLALTTIECIANPGHWEDMLNIEIAARLGQKWPAAI